MRRLDNKSDSTADKLIFKNEKMLQILTENKPGFNRTGKEDFIVKLRGLIVNNLRVNNLTVKWLASKMFYSERQMHRLVKKYTGKTVNRYIREVRLNQAKLLLERKGYSTKEVAYRVGYQKVSWFSGQYFLRFGKRPREV